ncbi:DUF4153 domain-containing protein [Actinoplanes sp. GCM10030250]|uniref:DUF4153 domain-containing protein n=1 Tax=Actinoplanes sp. GCM10030250 TaxID=3273376 RepID=UPI00360A10DF
MSTAPPAQNAEQKGQTGPLHGPWPALTETERRWPGPGRPASAATLLALLIAAVVAAFSVPLDRTGAGWLVTVIAGTAALVVARAVRDEEEIAPLVRRPEPSAARDRFFWAAATIALLGVGTFRAADWLFALCVMTATITSVLAISTGRSLRAIVAAYVIVPIAALRGLTWLRRGLTRLSSRRSNSTAVRAAGTAVVSIVLLTVFGSLFVSADAAFAGFFDALVPEIRVDSVFRWVFVGGVSFTLLGAAAFLRAAPPAAGDLDRTEGRKVGRWEWAVPLSLLTLLFAAFVAVQLTVLFGGSRHVVQTDGLTYAEYARSGFWQLCAVTALTLVVLAGAARWAPRTERTDRMLLRYVLGALTVLTFVIVASALHRMSVYTDMYGLTRLRLLVAACEVWFGLILCMVLVAGLRIHAPWLPRVALATGVLALLGLAAANPDGLIAENHVQRYERTARIDTGYLGSLSPDAVPALAELDDAERRACLLWAIGAATAPDESWREWNLGRQTARDLIADHPPADAEKCADEIYRD